MINYTKNTTNDKDILSALDVAIAEKKLAKDMMRNIGPLLVDYMTPTLDEQTRVFKTGLNSISQSISGMKIGTPIFNVPEIKIPDIKMKEVKLPQINVPEQKIDISTKGVEKALTDAFKTFKMPSIKVPKPEVTVNVPEMDFKWPDGNMTVEGLVDLKGISAKNPLNVQVRDSNGKPISFGEISGGGRSAYKQIKLENDTGVVVNPATEDKQDDIVTAVNNISGLQRATNLEGNGGSLIGTVAAEVVFTGTPESIIIKAGSANTSALYIGKSDVTSAGANALTYLDSGDEIILDYDDTTNALYVVAGGAAQSVWTGSLK